MRKLELTGSLTEIREVLEKEIRKVVEEIVTEKITREVDKVREESGLEEEIKKITWEYQPESDDEGGTDWWIYYVCIHGESGEIDAEEMTYTKKSKWSDSEYEVSLQEEINEILNDNRDDLYDCGIEEILL